MGWPKGKPRGPRKKAPAPKKVSASKTVTIGPEIAPEKAGSSGRQFYRNTYKAAVFASIGRIEPGEQVELDPTEAAMNTWLKPCQKPD